MKFSLDYSKIEYNAIPKTEKTSIGPRKHRWIVRLSFTFHVS